MGLRDAIVLVDLPLADAAALRDDFDKEYGKALDPSRSFRDAARAIQRLVVDHARALQEGRNWKRVGTGYSLDSTVEPDLQNQVSALLERGYSTIKGTQSLLRLFGIDIGCFFAKDAAFSKGTARLRSEGRSDLADYLAAVRAAWSQRFIHRRDALVHEGWRLPPMRHVLRNDGGLVMVEPLVDGEPVSLFARTALDRGLGFVEDVVVYAMSTRLEFPHIVREIPESDRDPDIPERFVRDFKRPSVEPWQIHFLDDYGLR